MREAETSQKSTPQLSIFKLPRALLVEARWDAEKQKEHHETVRRYEEI